MLEEMEYFLGHLTTVHDERMRMRHNQKGGHARQLGAVN
jgi:hypothetical protein